MRSRKEFWMDKRSDMILEELKEIKEMVRDRQGKRIEVDVKKNKGNVYGLGGRIVDVSEHVFTVRKTEGTWTSFSFKDVLMFRHGAGKYVFKF